MATYDEALQENVAISDTATLFETTRKYPVDGLLDRWQFEEGSGLDSVGSQAGLNLSFYNSFQYPVWSTVAASGSHSIVIPGPNVAYDPGGGNDADNEASGPTMSSDGITTGYRPTSGITLSCWIYKAVWSDYLEGEGVFQIHSGVNGTYDTLSTAFGGSGFYMLNGRLRFGVVSAGAQRRVIYDTRSLSSGFHLFTGTFDGRYVRLYADKTEVASYDMGSSGNTIDYYSSATVVAMFGAMHSSANPRYVARGTNLDGIIDDSAFWSRALSPYEVIGLYNATWFNVAGRESLFASDTSRYGTEHYHEVLALMDAFDSNEGVYGRALREALEAVTPITSDVGGVTSALGYERLSEQVDVTFTGLSTTLFNNLVTDVAQMGDEVAGVRAQLQTALELVQTTALSPVDTVLTLIEAIEAAATPTATGVFHSTALQKLSFKEKIVVSWLLSLLDGVTMTDSPELLRQKALKVVERLTATEAFESRLEAINAVAVSMVFSELIESGKGGSVSENMTLSDAMVDQIVGTAAQLEALAFTDTADQAMILSLPATENVTISDELSPQQILKGLVTDGVSFALSFGLGGKTYTGYAMNTKTGAVSTYSDLPFNSFARIGGDYYGANANGLYLLDGDTDAGADIDAEITLGAMDFTGDRQANVPECFLSLRNDGRILLKALTDDNIERWYEVSESSDVLRDRRALFGRGMASRYWTFSLRNIDGSDFELTGLDPVPIILKRR